MVVVSEKTKTPTPIRLKGEYPALESLVLASGLACKNCKGTGNALPQGALMEKCEECNGTGRAADQQKEGTNG